MYGFAKQKWPPTEALLYPLLHAGGRWSGKKTAPSRAVARSTAAAIFPEKECMRDKLDARYSDQNSDTT